MSNKYSGTCSGCGGNVPARAGKIERAGGRWLVWHTECFNQSDNSGIADRACGNREYEDQCSRAVGGENRSEYLGECGPD